MILSLNFIGDMLLMRTKIMLFRDYAIRRYAELEKYDNIPLENVILTPVENQRYSLYKIIKKYYPCGKFYFHGYENRFSCPCVSIWTNGYFYGLSAYVRFG